MPKDTRKQEIKCANGCDAHGTCRIGRSKVCQKCADEIMAVLRRMPERKGVE